MCIRDRFYKQTDGFVEQHIDDETILVPLVNSVAQMDEVLTLNELATFIYHRLENKASLQHICKEIVEEYEVSADEAMKDVTDFLSLALKKNIIREVE
jgi:hypothetical protein